MKIRVVGCDGGLLPGKLTTCFQITDSLLIDAGSAACGLDLTQQKKIRDIFISHIHIDHIKDLAFLADNCMGEVESIQIHALPDVNRALRKHYFNNQLWPDFTKLPTSHKPFYQLNDIVPEQEYTFGDVRVIPVEVDHTVPAVGFVLHDAEGSCIISGDTGPTQRIWEMAGQLDDIRLFIVETAFPNHLQELADGAKHFTPATLKEELKKFERPGIPIHLYHVKPKFAEEITKEIKSLGHANLKFLNNGQVLQLKT